MKKEVSFKDFKEFKEKYVDNFFPDNLDIWKRRTMLECMDNREMFDEVKELISINNDNTDSKDLDRIMSYLRKMANKYLKIDDSTKDEDYYDSLTKGIVYYGILESLDELGKYADDVINAIKTKYGDDYLSVISALDKAYLSVDGRKILKEEKDDSLDMTDDLLQKYLVLKEWQDKQHNYYQTVVEPILLSIEDDYMNNNKLSIDVKFREFQMHRKMLQLAEKDLISIDELAKCYLCGMDKELIKLVGGKAYGLTVLKAKGLPIPETYVIPVTSTNFDARRYQELKNDCHYAIRSSADIEDGEKHSFAGMFDSYLDIEKENIENSILKVIDSKNNSRLQKYIETNQLDQPNMAVIIQKYVEPSYSGVWIGKNSDNGYLEYVSGTGDKLVSGKVTPKTESWSKEKISKTALKCSDGLVGEKLLEYQKLVAENNGEVADFEWMVLDDKLVMLQYRPVTSKINVNIDEIRDGLDERFYGIPASPGIASSSARFVNAREIDKVNDWQDGDILMSWYTDPEWMDILSKSSGIVTAVGGFLCHAAIIARELGIPCVIGIGGNNMKKIWNEKELTINGNDGYVEKVMVKSKKL